MGSREARCYLASPEIVAASAVAGYICGPNGAQEQTPLERNFTALAKAAPRDHSVEILPGFPARVRGRLTFLPKENLNTDAIYAGQYTYREDMTPEMMAGVAFDNYDPEGSKLLRAGDVIVGGANFGSGSSREQAVTALKAKGIPVVISGCFSQTYLRNAFNNGFVCIEAPELVSALRAQFATQIQAGERTIIPGEEIDIDFGSSSLNWRGERYSFPALGAVPQSLVIAGGIENLVAHKLGFAAQRSAV
jgi:homoaconitate hydratase